MANTLLHLSFTGSGFDMGNDRMNGDRLIRDRDAVTMLLLGKPDPVQQVIQELHVCRFCEAGAWSRPLRLSDHQQQLILNPGEVMRIYKRYLTR